MVIKPCILCGAKYKGGKWACVDIKVDYDTTLERNFLCQSCARTFVAVASEKRLPTL